MISPEIVTQTWERMATAGPEDAVPLLEQMSQEQPIALAYLRAMSESPPLNEQDGQIMFYIGLVVWQIMRQSPQRLRKVTERKIERAEKGNEEALEIMASDTAADCVSATEHMLETYPEPHVLRYIVEAIMEDEDHDPDDPPIQDEVRGLVFVYLKTLLDAFVASLAR